MQDEVSQVIAQHRVAPNAVLHPESAMQKRIVLLGGSRSNQMRQRPWRDWSAGLVMWLASSQTRPPGAPASKPAESRRRSRPDGRIRQAKEVIRAMRAGGIFISAVPAMRDAFWPYRRIT